MKPKEYSILAGSIGAIVLFYGLMMSGETLFADLWIIGGLIIIALSIAIQGIIEQMGSDNSSSNPIQYCHQCGKVLAPSERICTRCGMVRPYK